MKKFIYNIFSKFKIGVLKTRKSKLDDLMFATIDKYYNLQNQNKIHEEAIARIINDSELDEKQKKFANDYIFRKKNDTDRTYNEKFGKKGKYMAELNKLNQILYFLLNNIDFNDENRKKIIIHKINKNFNKITLYMFDKYQI